MTRRRSFLVVPLVCLAVTFAAFSQAAEDVLSVIPEGALGFGVINRLAQTDATIQKVAGDLQLPVPSLLDQLKQATGIDKGLDEKGSAAFVVVPSEDDDEPAVLLYVPVTDYGQFIAALEPAEPEEGLSQVQVLRGRFLVGQDGGYAVFAEQRHRGALKAAIDSPNRLSDELAPLKDWLADHSGGLVVTRAGVEFISAMVQKGLRQVRENFGEMPPEFREQMEPAIAVFGVYEEIFVALERNIQTYAAAVRVDKQGTIHIDERTRLVPGGGLAKMLGRVERPDGDLLAGLPKGPFFFAMAGAVPEDAMDALMNFSGKMMKVMPKLYGLDEKETDELIKISRDSMKGVRGMAFMVGVGKPDEPLLSSMSTVMKVDDAPAFLANYRKTIDAMNAIMGDKKNSMFSGVKVKEIEIEGVPALEVRMKFPMPEEAAQMPGFDEMMKMMVGPNNRVVTYMAAADGQTIVSAYANKRALLRCIEAVKNPEARLSSNPRLAKTAAMLSAEAQWVGYLSPKGTIDFINRFMAVMPMPPQQKIQLPEFAPTPPIAFAVNAVPGEVVSHTVVPKAVLRAVGDFIVEVKKTFRREFRDLDEATEKTIDVPPSEEKPVEVPVF
ncbi:MAG TPA: hypothetical protein VMY42_19105 [Thermoguttaceae bacterium]|nr:hypothetical protein [Thermoguttaceae bacterium]